MPISGDEFRKAYTKGEMNGWAGVRYPELVRSEFNLLVQNGTLMPRFRLTNPSRSYRDGKMMLYEVTRKVLGKDTKNYPQEIGDCVSFGAKNATEYLQCTEILMKGERQAWRPVFPPYYYGTGRVYVGGGRLGNQDGSLGSWMAEAVRRYGTLWSDEEGCPKYSGRLAKAWGDPNPRSDLDVWKPKASEYLVQGAALVRTWNDLVTAICNGYPCTVASNVGYDMEASSDGFHRQRGSWGHQMCFIGVDNTYREPYAVILNSWGDAHGKLREFNGDGHLPPGCLRVRRADAEKHLRARETFAFSDLNGFPERELDKALFDLI